MIHALIYGVLCGLIASLIAYCVRLSRESDKTSTELSRAEERADSLSKQLKEALRDKQGMEAQIKGERVPCNLCEGCVHCINYTPLYDPISNYRPAPIYNCRKNIRCKEYEENETC